MEQNNSKWNVTFFSEISRTGKVFHLSVYSTSESGTAGRAGPAGTVVTDLDGRWTFIPK